MKKIKSKERMVSEEVVTYYQLLKKYSKEDICKIIDILSGNDVEMGNFHLSNTLERPDHLFRVFPTLKDLYTFPIEDYYVDNFGVKCLYNGIQFGLTFNFTKNQVITFTKGNIDLEDLLMQLEK